jgi:hypothetical protein
MLLQVNQCFMIFRVIERHWRKRSAFHVDPHELDKAGVELEPLGNRAAREDP